MVYFIQAGDRAGAIKIGWSTNPRRRLCDLRRSSPLDLMVRATVDCDRSVELCLQHHFAWCRSHGEWFWPEPELSRLVAEIAWGDLRKLNAIVG